MKYTMIIGFSLGLIFAGCGGSAAAPKEAMTDTKSPIGGACKGDGDCATGLLCDTDDPGGQCEKKCNSSSDCGSGAVCSDEKKCYRACQSNADCKRAGYACVGKAPNTFCDVADSNEAHAAEENKGHEHSE